MIRQRLEWLALAAIPVLALFALLHLNAQVAQSLQSEDVSRPLSISDEDIDDLNAPILREAEALGALSPYIEAHRIDLPIETLRQIALEEVRNLGLQGDYETYQEYFLTKGQFFTVRGMGVTALGLPDRDTPSFLIRYRGQVNNDGLTDADYIEIVIDASTGIPFSTSVGPNKAEYPIDVRTVDQGYPKFDTYLTPQAPLPVPPATG